MDLRGLGREPHHGRRVARLLIERATAGRSSGVLPMVAHRRQDRFCDPNTIGSVIASASASARFDSVTWSQSFAYSARQSVLPAMRAIRVTRPAATSRSASACRIAVCAIQAGSFSQW